MDARSFLEAHWPSRGHYCVAIPTNWIDEETGEKKSAYKHFIYDDIGDAVTQVDLLKPSHDVYFAVNTLKQSLKKKARTQENIGFARCLFADLDVGMDKPPKKFPSQKAAVEALVDFCETINLPLPTMTSSGNGVHCYWAFTKDMTVGKWLHYANLFFRLVMFHNFKADPSRIRDQCSVLRVPGTMNFKDKKNPKKVSVKHVGQPIDPDELWYILIDACEAAGISSDSAQRVIGKSTPAAEGGGNLTGPTEFQGRVPEYAQVLACCPQLQFIENNGGDLDYTHWHKALGLIRRCSDGREQAHRLSMLNYDDYDEAEVDKKLDEQEANDIGPTTCAVMAAASGNDLCDDCAFLNRTISPINTPYTPKVLSPADLPKPTVQISATQQYTFTPPPLPPGYQWVTKSDDKSSTPIGVGFLTEKEGREIVIQFLDYLLFPISRQINYSGNGDQHIWCVHIPHEDPKTFVIPSETISDQRELLNVLNRHGVYIDLSYFKMVQSFMSAYIKRLQRDCKPETKHLHYGWVDENKGFIIGDHKLIKGGKTEPVQTSGGASDLLDVFSLKRSGTLELQVEAMRHFTRRNEPREQFYILCALASPLLHMLDNYYGVTINATGETGGGKTGLLFAGMAFWGNPRKCYMSGVKDEGATPRARLNALFAMHSLPFALDEISGIEPEAARSFTYAVTQATGRHTASKEGGLRKTTGTSNSSDDNDDFRANFVLSTSNGSLHSRLSESSVVGAATSARVVEIDYPPLPPDVKVQGDEMMALILQNYGHIGEVFIRYILDHYDVVKSQVRDKAKEVERVYGVKIAERFLSSVAPCIFIASVIARKLGLLDFDEERIIHWLMVEQLARIRGIMSMEYTSPVHAITDLIDETITSMVIADKFNGKVLEPHIPKFQPIKGRYEKHEGVLYVSSEVLHVYFSRKRLPRKEFLNALMEMKVIIGPARMVLARGTDFAGGRTACYAINMAHKEMSDTADAVKAEEVTRLKVVVDNTKPEAAPSKIDPASLKLLRDDTEDDDD